MVFLHEAVVRFRRVGHAVDVRLGHLSRLRGAGLAGHAFLEAGLLRVRCAHFLGRFRRLRGLRLLDVRRAIARRPVALVVIHGGAKALRTSLHGALGIFCDGVLVEAAHVLARLRFVVLGRWKGHECLL